MKNCFAASRILLCAAFLLILGGSVGAQTLNGPDMPPAYGVAQRLQAEAAAARAAGQFEIAHRRYYQSVIQLQAVVKSRAYKQTIYAREALRQQAKIEEDFLQDKNAAVQSLQTLHNTFPDDQAVGPEIKRVGDALDKFNQTITPQSTPFHILGATLYKVMDFLVKLTGSQTWSYWLAILLVSILVKLALTPLSNKQYGSMREMQKLQPAIQELQAKHKSDKELLGRKMMELYKEHGVNPAAGCAPLIVQLPILYMLYYMIRLYQYQFSHGTFLWIGSGLAHFYPNILAINLGQPDWPLLLMYAGSMYITQRMTITPAMDPQQAETQKMMTIMTPFMTTYFFYQYHLPSAFVLYYLIFNVLSTAQQKYYLRKRAGDTPPMGSDGDGGTKRFPLMPNGTGGGQAKPASANGNGNGNGSRRLTGSPVVPVAEASERHTNGAVPTAKGVIAPKRVHPKKKRR
jgi:YidC/Oxa1 family membrane protein insertase